MEYFGRAKTAKEKYANSQEYEGTVIDKYTNDIDGYISGNRDYETEISNLKNIISELQHRIETLEDNSIKYPDYTKSAITTITTRGASWTATEDCFLIGHIWKDANTNKAIVSIDNVPVFTSHNTNSDTYERDFPPIYVKKGSVVSTRGDSGYYYLIAYPVK